MANLDLSEMDLKEICDQLGERLSELVSNWLDEADPKLPVILAAHASVEGAQYGNERMVMLGRDLVLPPALVKDDRLDYVALGHIHKPQNLNESAHPPVIYPGSIERVDFGEANDEKFFIVAEIEKGHTNVHWRKLDNVRPFIDLSIELQSDQEINRLLQEELLSKGALDGAIVRMVIEYPRDWEPLIDETALRKTAESAFEFHLVKRPGLMQECVCRKEKRQYHGCIGTAGCVLGCQRKRYGKIQERIIKSLARTIMDDVKSGD